MASLKLLASKGFGHFRVPVAQVVDGLRVYTQLARHLFGRVALVRCYTRHSRLRLKAVPIRGFDLTVFHRLIADIPTVLGHGANRAEAIGGV